MGKIGIIIQREFNERVRKKSFILTTLLTPLLFVGMMVAIFLLARVSLSETREIAVIDHSGVVARQLESDRTVMFIPTAKSQEDIRREKSDGQHENLYGILVIGEDIMTNTSAVTLYTYQPSTIEVETVLATRISDIVENEKLKQFDIEDLPQILEAVKTNVSLSAYRIDESGNDKQSSSGLAMGLAYIFGFLIYMFVFMYGAMVMQGVIEEKSSKVIEVIVSSVKPYQLMMGKILGIASVAVTQFLIWAVFLVVAQMALVSLFPGLVEGAAAGMADSAPVDMATVQAMDPDIAAMVETLSDGMFLFKLLGGFLIFFIGGYLLYAAMFAAVGSAVDNVADSQQLQLPITVPLILAIVIMINVMREPNSPVAFWFSMIPFTSPIIMIARIPYGVPGWEIALSAVILFATFALMVWLAAKIYRVGIFMHGKKPTLAELIKWARYKY